ncbi:MAG: sensor histidine kinase [Candidatus Marinimicrobia bacterium]|nr:sensor histidine kinase [Candidatus Neomarinimicrobiota bacterium]
MRYEYTQSLSLDHEDLSKVDLHSLLNIMNILISLFYQAGRAIGDRDRLEPAIEKVYVIVEFMQDSSRIKGYLENFKEFKTITLDTLKRVEEDFPDRYNARVAEEVESVINILEIRSIEWLKRVEHPQQWDVLEVRRLKQNFLDVFKAVEKYSQGRYRIVERPEEHGSDDYLIELAFRSKQKNVVYIPSVFQDVMRDTLLNARKYTPLGGHISGVLSTNRDSILWEVKDDGIGIPEVDLPRIIELGFRAGNVTDRRTMGAGFGLTKAYLVAKQFSGRMWIDSEVGKGTLLTIEIPFPDVKM